MATDPTAPGPAASETPSLARVARSVSWMGAGYGLSQLLWFASLLVLAALLPPRDFGTLAAGLVLVNVAGLLVDSGTRGSLIAAPTLSREDIRGAVALNVAVGLAATAAIALVAGPMIDAFAGGGDPWALRALSAGVVLYAVGITPMALLQKRMEFRRHAGVNVAAAVVSSIVAIVAAVLGAGVWALVLRQLLSMALLSVFAWVAARDLIPAAGGEGARRGLRLARPGWGAFLALALADFVALNADFLVVGNLTEAEGLGLYSLAFTLAFAPLTQVSWQVGRVLFPAAAATSDPETVGRRTLKSARLIALLLLPVLPPLIVLADPLLPDLLGEEWRGMVTPFRLLLVAGVGHAVLGMIGESLSGTGRIGWRAKVNAVWAAGMVLALLVLVDADGLRGAALAHLLLFVPLAVAYFGPGVRHLGMTPGDAGRALAPVLVPCGAQAAATAASFLALDAAGAPKGVAATGAAVIGLGVLAAALLRGERALLREGRSVVAAAATREA